MLLHEPCSFLRLDPPVFSVSQIVSARMRRVLRQQAAALDV